MDIFEDLNVLRYYESGEFYVAYGIDEEGRVCLVKFESNAFYSFEYPSEELADKDFCEFVKQDLAHEDY